MNPFLTREGSERRFIRRLYARVDQREDFSKRERWHVLLDAIDADFFDAAERDERFFDRLPLRVVEWYVPLWMDFFLPWFLEMYPEDGSPVWLEVILTQMPTPYEVWVYPGLAAEPEAQYVEYVHHVDRATAARLDSEFSLDDHPDATSADLLSALGNPTGVQFVAVYDVGQGNCNAICDRTPLVYFDFGGGVLGNTHTFPAAQARWCLAHSPPVVLSHWDWDHWSSATLRFQAALRLTWIVPRQQPLGAVHKTFAHSVSTTGRLLVWPSTLPTLTSGQLTVLRCTGRGRNHSGLAMSVTDTSAPAFSMLLTGDARYTAIPGVNAMKNLTAVIVPHHGADMRSRVVPSCAVGCPNPRAAYSFGRGNGFSHPRVVTQQSHDRAGWRHAGISGPPDLARETANRSIQGLGHVALHWHPAPPPPLPCRGGGCPGGGSCDLAIQQT